MRKYRILLFPFALLYVGIITFRSVLFRLNILKSKRFDFPVICIGNLSTGGSGKSPHTEYLIELLKNFNLGVVSRGYGRRTKGGVLASEQSTSTEIGDEPKQFKNKFPFIHLYLDEKRKRGIEELKRLYPQIQVILLDDAFQHQFVDAGLKLMLSDYTLPYFEDHILPWGNLREPQWGAHRADAIIITKCPKDLSDAEQLKIIKKIKVRPHQRVYFSTLIYKEFTAVFSAQKQTSLEHKNILLFCGIANPKPLISHLNSLGNQVKLINFADHHVFTKKEIENIINTYKAGGFTHIVTTEKDVKRMQDFSYFSMFQDFPLYYVPIQIKIINQESEFNQYILNYVQQG